MNGIAQTGAGDTRKQGRLLAPTHLSTPAVGAREFSERERAAWYWTVSPADELDYLAWVLLRWLIDPVLFCYECLLMALFPYQAQALLDLANAPRELYEFYGLDPGRPKRAVLMPSGHGLGKTRTLAAAIWWHKLTRKASRRLVTAPTSDQITGQLWGEVRKLHRRMHEHWPMLAQDWEVLGSSITHKDPAWGDWETKARTARPDKPEGLQGSHGMDDDDPFGDLAEAFGIERSGATSGGMMVVIEEASGVEDSIREVLKGALSEPDALLLAAGNPTRNDGWFAEDLERTDQYSVIRLDCRMSDSRQVYSLPYRTMGGAVRDVRIQGRVQPKYWEDLLRECDGDEDHDKFRVRVRGLKPRSNFIQVIKTHWLEEAAKRSPDPSSAHAPAVIGLDFGENNDKHGIAATRGPAVLDAEEWLKRDRPDDVVSEAVRRAMDWVEQYRARFLVGDANGIGVHAMETLADYYHVQHPELGVRVIFFRAGKSANNPRYYRQRDKMWYQDGRRFFSDPRCSIPNDPALIKQLRTPGYHEDDRKKIRVESKSEVEKRTGSPSGNIADAVLQAVTVNVPEGMSAEPEKRVEDPPAHPAVFERHFRRFRDQAQDRYIR